MEFSTFVKYILAILETVFLILAIVGIAKGVKTKNYEKFKNYGAIYLILNLIRNVSSFLEKKAVTVSVIGGADGPTSIFLAGKVGDVSFLGKCACGIIVIVFVIGVFLFIKKKKR